MRDQASTLRNLIQRQAVAEPTVGGERARVVAFTSGKGGVGKSNLALNVAVAAAQVGSRVCVFDANCGLGNIDVLCGLNSYWNFSHVMTGARTLSEVIQKGPAGINVLSGANGLIDLDSSRERQSQDLNEQIATIDAAYDLLIIDTGTGFSQTAQRFAAVADVTFLVMTPEPTAIADGYSMLKSWQGNVSRMPEVLVNRTTSTAQAKQILGRFSQTVSTFLSREIPHGSFVTEDSSVAKAVLARQPFVCLDSDGAASREVRTIAKRLLAGAKPTGSLWKKLLASDFAD